jgi:transcriptional regulator with PAS, ATPase and Fis domain
MDDATTFDLTQSPAARAARPRAYLAVVAGLESQIVPLPRGQEVSVGRSHSCDVSIDDLAVSRLQCTLCWDGDDVVRLEDHGSRNGTFVDGVRVVRPVRLSSGQEVAVGPVRMVVSVAPASSRGGGARRAEADWSAVVPAGSALSGGPVRASGTPQDDDDHDDDDEVVAKDPRSLETLAFAAKAARGEVTVILIGETGVGKETFARRIHRESRRAVGPFVSVSCGALPAALAEGVLFGYEAGAVPSAPDGRPGKIEEATGGTLFLDDVDALDAAAQTRLLQTLEEGVVVRLGGTEGRPVDPRYIAATQSDLRGLVDQGAFREELLYRLDVLRIDVAPLRDRPADILPLALRFLRELAPDRRTTLAPDAIRALNGHDWPGNVRELRNAMERALALSDGPFLRAADLDLRRDSTGPRALPGPRRPSSAPPGSAGGKLRSQVDDAERDAIVAALDAEGGNQTKAAARLGIARRTLIYKMERFGLKPPPKRY